MNIDLTRRTQAQTLFEEALKYPLRERAAYLESACPEDPVLRAYVMRLLDLDGSDNAFLETPVLTQILSAPLLETGDLVDGRFRILDYVDGGGMGEVYEAEDTELGERVALKTVRRDLTGLVETAARLRREIELAHRIAHPNVCKIHYLGIDHRPEGDLLYLTMDFLEGETLARRLERAGPFAGDEAYAIGAQIAAGLDAAHDEGVIHSDLKASNIMLVRRGDGSVRAVIMDFGIATSVEAGEPQVAGTPAYIAPERLSEPESPKSDMYAFGVVLYEMVTGRKPFDAAELPRRRQRLPRPPSSVNRAVGKRWDRAILRCLHPDPGKRFSRAADALLYTRAPRWPVAAAACLAIAIAGLVVWARTSAPFRVWLLSRGGPRQVLAIMPFVQDGGSLDSGFTENLAAEIRKNQSVRSKWLVFTPVELSQLGVTSPAQARAVVGATHVLTGKLTRGSESVTIAAQVVELATSRQTGAFQRSCPPDNVACLQGGMLSDTAGALGSGVVAFTAPPPMSADSFSFYLQGLHYLDRDSLSYDLAISFFQKAIEREPAAVQPRIAMADAYVLWFRDTVQKDKLAAARAMLNQVMTTNPGLADLHASLGNLDRVEGRYEDAIRELQVAVQGDPSNYLSHLRLARAYDQAHQDANAVAEFETGIQLQPRFWGGYLDFAVFHHNRGRFREAAALLEQLILWAPDHAQGLATLGGVYVNMGRNQDAERVSRRSCELKPDKTCFSNLATAVKGEGRIREALTYYEKALAFGSPTTILLLNMADAHDQLNERPQALDFYRRSAARAEEVLKVNLRDSELRAIMAYCLAQTGQQQRAEFEMQQAMQDAPGNKNVRKYSILTYEILGQRDRALDLLREATPDLLGEMERGHVTEGMRRDPRYPEIAAKIRNK